MRSGVAPCVTRPDPRRCSTQDREVNQRLAGKGCARSCVGEGRIPAARLAHARRPYATYRLAAQGTRRRTRWRGGRDVHARVERVVQAARGGARVHRVLPAHARLRPQRGERRAVRGRLRPLEGAGGAHAGRAPQVDVRVSAAAHGAQRVRLREHAADAQRRRNVVRGRRRRSWRRRLSPMAGAAAAAETCRVLRGTLPAGAR